MYHGVDANSTSHGVISIYGLLVRASGQDMQRLRMQPRDQKTVFWFIMDCLWEVKGLADIDRSSDVDMGVPEQVTLSLVNARLPPTQHRMALIQPAVHRVTSFLTECRIATTKGCFACNCCIQEVYK